MERQNKKIYVMNTLIIPIDFNKYPKAIIQAEKISVEEAKQILQNGFISAIGHEGTANLLSKIFGMNIPTNRISVYFEKGDIGIHFYLKNRLPEGKVLTEEELSKLDFWLVKSQVL
jgi:hypothetical protein